MNYSFNLTDQKWIPCTYFDGHIEELSLSEVLTNAHDLRGIQGDSPLETAALYRLLLAILHSVLRGPETRTEWSKLWEHGCWKQELINDYLKKWRNCFDLFDSVRPFYQAADERAKPKSVITLVMDMSSGNNAALFDHHTEMEGAILSPAKAARALIVAQGFGLAGLFIQGATFTDAPWGRGVIFIVEGDNLFKTLALNLVSYPDKDRNRMASSREDKPAWEKDDPYEPSRLIPEGYLDYLTWQNRRIMLLPEGDAATPIVRSMTMAPGLRLDSSILDPMKLYRAGKEEGYISTRFSEGRALWRDSASLFGLRSERGNFPPQTFYWLAALAAEDYIPQQQTYRFMALGMANDQAKVEFFQEEHLPLPLTYLEKDELVEQLASAIELAEKTRFALRVSVQRMALLVVSPKSDGKKWQEVDRLSKEHAEKLMEQWNVDRFYWQRLGIPFLQFLEDLPKQTDALKVWKGVIWQAAQDAFEQASNFCGIDVTALKAITRAQIIMRAGLKELF